MFKIKYCALLLLTGWLTYTQGSPSSYFCEPVIQEIFTSDPTDCNVNDGQIEIIATGNNGVLEYSIDGGILWQSAATFTDLPAGAYLISVRNADGSCVVQHSTAITLAGPDSPRFIEVQSTDPTNCQNNNGTINIYAEGGTGPYQYSIDDGNSWGIESFITGLSPGTYTVMVRNADGTCPTTHVFPIILNPVLPPVVEGVWVIAPTDCGLDDGILEIVVSGGNGNFQYSIDDGANWQNHGFFDNLAPGSYLFRIKYGDGTCEITHGPVSIVALEPPMINDVIPTNPTDCNLNDGSISIEADGSMLPLQYSIDDGTTWQFEPLFLNLGPGTYQIKVRNENGSCLQSYPATTVLTSPPLPEIQNIEATDVDDCGANNGQIWIEATGGNPPLEYSIDNGLQWQSQPLFSNLLPGVYTVQVRNDDGSCQIVHPIAFTITEPTVPTIEEVTLSHPTDCGLANGQINILASSTNNTGLEYSIDNGDTWHTTTNFTQLAAGTYQIQVRNLDGTCPVDHSTPIELVEPTIPVIQGINYQNPSDCDVQDGWIQFIVPGNVPVEYSIDGGNHWQTNGFFSQLGPGTYTPLVQNLDGSCSAPYESSINLESPFAPVIQEISSTHPTDCEVENGTIQIAVLEGAGSFDYSIDGGQTWQGLGTFTGLPEGTYQVEVRNSDQTCSVTHNQSIELISPVPPMIDETIATSPSDCGLSDGSIQFIAGGNAAEYEFSVDGGQNWQGSPLFSSLPPGSYELHIRNADGSCLDLSLEPIELLPPAPPVINWVQGTSPTECGVANGSIQIQAAVISGQLEYSIDGGNNWTTDDNFVSLNGGSYQVMVRTANSSCPPTTYPSLIQLEAPSQPLFANVEVHPVSNCGLNDGSITIQTGGDTGSYLFGLQLPDGAVAWQTTPTFGQLPPGSYLPLLRNIDNSCQVSYYESLVIESIEGPIVGNIESSSPSDCALTDGHILVQLQNIPGDVSYSIDGGTSWQSNALFDNLPAGEYIVIVSNADGTCTTQAEDVIYLNAPAPPLYEVTSSNPTDCDLADGSISITSNNPEDLQYSIDGGQNWSGSGIFTNLNDGIFEVSVQYTNGTCQTPYGESVQLIAPSQPQFDVHAIPISDCGLSDGAIEIQLADGNGAYEFSIDNGNTWNVNPVFTELHPGNYQVQVRNSDGSCATQPASITLEAPLLPSVLSVLPTNPSNCGATDGAIQILATGSSSELSYSINGGLSWQEEPNFTGLAAGDFQVMVQNQDGTCTNAFEQTITLVEPAAPEMEIIQYHPSDCGSNDGSIQINILNGEVADYQFLIFGETPQSSNIFSNLSEGTYQIFALSSNQTCHTNFEAVVQLIAPTPPSFSFDFQHPSDCGEQNGAIQFFASGGGSYEYSIDNGINWHSTSSFDQLSQGSYQLKVRNEDGSCANEEAFTVILYEPTPPTITVEAVDPSDCGLNDGQLFIESTNIGNHEYSIDGGQHWSSNTSFQDLPPGAYTIMARNEGGSCPVAHESAVELSSPQPPTIDLSVQQPDECFIGNGTIQIFASGGAGSYEYSIDGGNNWTNQSLFQELPAGNYQIKVRNANGTCPVDYELPVLLEQPVPPQIEVNYSDPSDCGEADGIIAITASGGNGPFEYSIDNGDSWSSNPVFSQLPNGVYQPAIRQTDGNCLVQSPEAVPLTSPGAPELEVIAGNPTDCGLENGWIQVFATGGNGSYEYSLDYGAVWQVSPIFDALPPGSYQVSVRNADGTCFVHANHSIEIQAPEDLEFQAESISPSGCGLADGSINISAQGGSGNYEYSINNGVSWENTPIFSNLSAGIYQLKVRNADGTCPSELVQTITLTEPAPTELEIQFSHPTDCGASDGSISIPTEIPGNGFQYSINGGQSWQSSTHFLELPEGFYQPMARHVNGGCESPPSAPVELIAPLAPVFEVVSTSPTDCDTPNGFISINTPGSNNFRFSIDDGLSWHPTPNFLNLDAGTYRVKVRNADGSCETNYPQSVVLSSPPAPSFSVVAHDPTSCIEGDGSLIIENQGSTPLEFSINNGNSWQGSGWFENLSAGTYSVMARTTMGHCESTYDQPIVLSDPALPEVSIASQGPTDCEVANGSILISNQNTDHALEYSVDGGHTWSSQNEISNLSVGVYQLQMRTIEGHCEQNHPEMIILDEPDLPEINQVTYSNPTDCGNEDGSISIADLVAIGQYQYSIDGGNSWHYQTTFNNLAAGHYELAIKNAEGNCINDYAEDIELIAPIPPQIEDVFFRHPTDCSVDNGRIAFQPNDTSAGYQYSIDNGHTWSFDPIFHHLEPGTYQLKAKLANGNCEVTLEEEIELTEPALPQIDAVVAQAPANCEQNNGSILIQLTNPSSTYEYSIDGGSSWTSAASFSNLFPGTYEIAVKNGSGNCQTFAPEPVSFEVVEPLQSNLDMVNAPTCFGTNDGTISITATGGQAPYAIDWSNGQTGSSVFNLSAGSYSATITDARMCQTEITNVFLEEPAAVTIALGSNIDTTVCLGQNVEFSFSDTTLFYSWTSDNGFASDSSAIVINESGSYWLEVTDEAGCTASDSINVSYLETFFDADFLLPTEGVINQPIVAVDITWPLPDSVRWEYNPDSIWHQETNANQETVIFPEAGIYSLGLYTYYGECHGIIEKTIQIFSSPDSLSNQNLDNQQSNITAFNLFPNPNHGTFDVTIGLVDPQAVTLWVFRGDGLVLEQRELVDADHYTEHFAFANLHPGLYTVVMQSGEEWLHLNFVVE